MSLLYVACSNSQWFRMPNITILFKAILDAVSLLAVGWKAIIAHPRTKNHILRSLSTERFGYLLVRRSLFLIKLVHTEARLNI